MRDREEIVPIVLGELFLLEPLPVCLVHVIDQGQCCCAYLK